MDGIRITGTIVRRLAVVVLLGATFVGSAMLTVYGLFHSGQVLVPQVVGMSQEDAKRAVERAGLVFKPRRIHFDGQVPPGTVSEQDPVAEFPVKYGYEVKVDLSKGPNPTGEPEEEIELPGPTNPVEPPKDAPKKPKKNANANGNANSNSPANANSPANGNAKKPDNSNAKPTATNSAKPPEGGADKPKPETRKPEDKPKPKPKAPPPAR